MLFLSVTLSRLTFLSPPPSLTNLYDVSTQTAFPNLLSLVVIQVIFVRTVRLVQPLSVILHSSPLSTYKGVFVVQKETELEVF